MALTSKAENIYSWHLMPLRLPKVRFHLRPNPVNGERERERESMLSISTLRGARKYSYGNAFATSQSGLVWPQLTKDSNDKGKSINNNFGGHRL